MADLTTALIELRNDSVSTINLGTLAIGAGETVRLWRPNVGDRTARSNLNEAMANVDDLNTNIDSQDLVLIEDGGDLSRPDGFALISQLMGVQQAAVAAALVEDYAADSRAQLEEDDLGSFSTDLAIDFSDSVHQLITVTAALSITSFTVPGPGDYKLRIINAGNEAITFPGGITWEGGSAFSTAAATQSLIRFYSPDGAEIWAEGTAFSA